MANGNYEIDPALLAEFIDESEEALAEIPGRFVELEKTPSELSIIEAVFRPIHSLKGNAAYFGLLRTKALAHELETLLDKMRTGRIAAAPKHIDLLLEGTDALMKMLGRAREGRPELHDETAFEERLSRVRSAASQPRAGGPGVAEAAAALRSVIDSLGEEPQGLRGELEKVVGLLAAAEGDEVEQSGDSPRRGKAAGEPEAVGRLTALLAEPFSGCLPEEKSVEVRECLTVIAETVEGAAAKAVVDRTVDAYETMVSTVGFDNLLRELILDGLEELRGLNPWKACEERSGGERTAEVPSDRAAAKAAGKTMRVAEESIDAFLEYVGELITVREMLGHFLKSLADRGTDRKLTQEIRRINESFEELAGNLQRSIMNVRKVPVRGVVRKFPRLVRDVASAAGKRIEVNVWGEEIEIDKSLVEALEAPLVHMVRNAADHGIETPELREKAGKPPVGAIGIGVAEEGDFVVVTVRDDGAGLDEEAIRRKAVEAGLIETDRVPTTEEIVELLFHSGLSTAERVTDISGRGVGMDVVKHNIDEVGGRIEVKSRRGEGTRVIVRVPKNVGTQIIEGFVVRVDNERFVLPVESVVEAFDVAGDRLTDVVGGGKCVERRGSLMPYRSLADTFGMGDGTTGNGRVTMVAVQHNGKRCCLGVDEILGLQQVVLKPVRGLEHTEGFFAGAAVTGSGRVSMVVDVGAVV